MSLNMLNVNYFKSSEVNDDEKLLSPEEKKNLGEVWTEMVVDDDSVPENISEMKEEEIKRWLFESIKKDTEKLVTELGLEVDNELIDRIKMTEDLNERATLELECVKKLHIQFEALTSNFNNLPGKSTKWDSWPKIIRESGRFNCTGATMLGMNLLEKGGLKSYFGSPVGHAVNIVKLANGKWCYVDFRNNDQNVIILDSEEVVMNNTTVLKTKHAGLDYQLVPFYDNSNIVGPVLGNLAYLKRHADGFDSGYEEAEMKDAQAHLEKFSTNYNKFDFSALLNSLYPKLSEIEQSTEMQGEIKRIEEVKNFTKQLEDYGKTLTRKQIEALNVEIKASRVTIENLFYKKNESVLTQVSPELKTLLDMCIKTLDGIKDKDSEAYREIFAKIMSRMQL